jgi:hypothetical protein
MGVNRRAGEALYFGAVPGKVLQKSKASLLFLAASALGRPETGSQK